MDLVFSKHFNKMKTLLKKPNYILIIDNFKTVTEENLKILREQTGIQLITTKVILENETYPDLIILFNNKFVFNLDQPLLLYKAEIWFSRECFSYEIFFRAIKHFSECEIRNGK